MKPWMFVIGLLILIAIGVIVVLTKKPKEDYRKDTEEDPHYDLNKMKVDEVSCIVTLSEDDKYKLMMDTFNKNDSEALKELWLKNHRSIELVLEINSIINAMTLHIDNWKESFTFGEMTQNYDGYLLRGILNDAETLKTVMGDLAIPPEAQVKEPEASEIPESGTITYNEREGEVHYL